jgi:hypothetical protein
MVYRIHRIIVKYITWLLVAKAQDVLCNYNMQGTDIVMGIWIFMDSYHHTNEISAAS